MHMNILYMAHTLYFPVKDTIPLQGRTQYACITVYNTDKLSAFHPDIVVFIFSSQTKPRKQFHETVRLVE
jgi:hypothetical protein